MLQKIFFVFLMSLSTNIFAEPAEYSELTTDGDPQFFTTVEDFVCPLEQEGAQNVTEAMASPEVETSPSATGAE